MNIWIVRQSSSWHIYDFHGNFLGMDNWMCNCKGYASILGIPWKRISDRSSLEELLSFFIITGIMYSYEYEDPGETNMY